MHHALEIQEILLNIFGHCHPDDLPSLARTCRGFKEPALDVLWEELDNLSPLVRCLPEASHQLSPDKVRRFQVFVTLRLMVNFFRFSPAIPPISIRLADRLRRTSGISFKVMHVASDPCRTSSEDSTRNPSESSRTLLPPSHSSRTSAI
ncbi:hypothetical protein OG21DRAFT_1469182 [Imleria badia]|nr:hypothetical protein OG21DRAFT_1469182 [Imleria badia]